MSTLFRSSGDHQELRRWLWSVQLADGTRALTASGRWQEAHTHLRRHKGIGRRMFDGRQVAVIAHLTAGAPGQALRLLAETGPGEPWEEAVTACLTALYRRHAGLPVMASMATLVRGWERLHPASDLLVFHTRLGLAVIDAADFCGTSAARSIITDLVQRAVAAKDGYAARDILRRGHRLPTQRQSQLRKLLEASGLDQGAMPLDLRARLRTAVVTAESVLLENQRPLRSDAIASSCGMPITTL